MARPTTAKHHTQCSHCDAEMPPVKHKRPFAKMCHDCRGQTIGTKGDLSQITIELKNRHALSGMDKIFATEDWGFLTLLGGKEIPNVIYRKPKW
jgi:hypothetical protein